MSEEIVKKSEEIVKIVEGEEVPDSPASSADETNGPVTSAELDKPVLSQDDKTMGMLAHLLGIFTSFVGALIIWLTQKESSPFVEEEAKEALNFQITIMIYYAVVTVASFILTIVTLGLFAMIAPVIYPALGIFAVVVSILGAVQAKEGKHYKYPLSIRFIK